MTFSDYVRHELGGGTTEVEERDWLSVAVTPSARGLRAGLVDSILQSRMAARLNASRANGTFPLVVWAPRHETTPAQSVLSEYLASHGYVVAAVRFQGPRLPYPWEIQTDEERTQTFEAHLSHLDIALRTLASAGSVDSTRVAILTWSYAEEVAGVAATTHPNVVLVIGLSSNPLTESGVYDSGGVLASTPVAELSASYVLITEAVAPDGTDRTPPDVLEELPTWSAFVRFNALSHGNFNVLEGMIPGVFGITDVHPWSRGGPAARHGYETIARYVLAFLDYGMPVGPQPPSRAWPWDSEESGGAVRTTMLSK